MSTNMYDLMIWNQLSFTEKLYRLRKGKACVRPEDEEQSAERPHLGLLGSTQPAERLNRPLIRPLSLEPLHESNGHLPPANGHLPPANGHLPPPPAKHIEREKYFQGTKPDGSGLAGHVRGLSLHRRNASSSRSGSMDFSEWLLYSRGLSCMTRFLFSQVFFFIYW